MEKKTLEKTKQKQKSEIKKMLVLELTKEILRTKNQQK